MKDLIDKYDAFKKALKQEYKKSIESEDVNGAQEDKQGALIILKEQLMPSVEKEMKLLKKH